jgi:hypothetical protein
MIKRWNGTEWVPAEEDLSVATQTSSFPPVDLSWNWFDDSEVQ